MTSMGRVRFFSQMARGFDLKQNKSLMTPIERISLVMGSALVSFWDPERADMIAMLGELTGDAALTRMLGQMKCSEDGAWLLRHRPVVRGESFSPHSLSSTYPSGSFGHAYGAYLESHSFSPDERTPVRWVRDPELAYVMLRYREVHDYLHVLSGLPPTVLGEISLKWLEMVQTGMPVAGLSALVGPLRLSSQERRALFSVYAPWAIKASATLSVPLMSVRYEELLPLSLQEARAAINLTPAPQGYC